MNTVLDAYIDISDDPDVRNAYFGNDQFSPLALALDACVRIPGVRRVMLPAKRWENELREIPQVAKLLEVDRVRLLDALDDPDISARAVGQRLRAWSMTGSLHGLLMTTEFCSYGNVNRILKSLTRPAPDWVLILSSNHAFITEEIVRSLFDQANKSEWNERFFCAEGPRGMVPYIAHRDMLEEHAAENIILQNEWRSRVIFWGKPIAHVPFSVITTSRNFTLENARARSFTQKVVDQLLAETSEPIDAGVSMERIAAAGRSLYDEWVGDLPRDVEIEITTRRPIDPTYLPKLSREERDMTLEEFEKIVTQLGEDKHTITITLGGHGDPCEHPHLVDFVRLAKQHARAVCLRTFGLSLSPTTYLELVDLDLDTLNIRFGYWDHDEYERANGIDAFEEVRSQIVTYLRDNIETRQSIFPTIVPEVIKGMAGDKGLVDFYEKWGERLAWPTISNYKTWDGAIEPNQAIELYPGERRTCDRITLQLKIYADGTVPICAVDFDGKRPAGNAFKTPIKEIWRGDVMTKMRESHKQGKFDKENPACTKCLEWFRLD